MTASATSLLDLVPPPSPSGMGYSPLPSTLYSLSLELWGLLLFPILVARNIPFPPWSQAPIHPPNTPFGLPPCCWDPVGGLSTSLLHVLRLPSGISTLAQGLSLSIWIMMPLANHLWLPWPHLRFARPCHHHCHLGVSLHAGLIMVTHPHPSPAPGSSGGLWGLRHASCINSPWLPSFHFHLLMEPSCCATLNHQPFTTRPLHCRLMWLH